MVSVNRAEVTPMIAQPVHKIAIFSLAITMLWLVSACSSTPPTSSGREAVRIDRTPQPGIGEAAARIARQQVGVPYRYGGSSPDGFDCSGLVHYSYARAGVRVPRTTGQLWSASRPVDRSDLRTGDLLFFSIDGKMSHVGMYLGEQRFVHAPSSGRTVAIASLASPYYEKAFLRGGRPDQGREPTGR